MQSTKCPLTAKMIDQNLLGLSISFMKFQLFDSLSSTKICFSHCEKSLDTQRLKENFEDVK